MENQNTAVTLNQISRYKDSTPFSSSLNNLILQVFADTFLIDGRPKVVFIAYEPYGSFAAMINDITSNNRLKISTLHCDKTIFGNPVINQMFRAVHDYLHYIYMLDFSHESELQVNYYQNIIFKRLKASQFDLDLLNIETAGQIVYHKKFGTFPDNQRAFTYGQLKEMGY